MDRGLWITWYDLPQDGRAAYLAWLHESYIPAILKRPGVLWAAHYASEAKVNMPRKNNPSHNTDDLSIPAGDRYILFFGAQDAHLFGDPTPNELHAALPAEGRRMLAMRVGERVNVMTETARVEGPALRDYTAGMALAPCIQIGTFNCAWQHEDEMLAWYTRGRMRAMITLPGSIRTRKLASVAGWAKHGVLYEFESLDMHTRHYPGHEDQDSDLKAWSDKVILTLTHAPGSANLAQRIWPPVAD